MIILCNIRMFELASGTPVESLQCVWFTVHPTPLFCAIILNYLKIPLCILDGYKKQQTSSCSKLMEINFDSIKGDVKKNCTWHKLPHYLD